MKSGIHPEYHLITVKMTDGTTYASRSTWGKEGDVLQLDVDPKTHPAWGNGNVSLKKTGQMEKFSNRFKAFSFDAKTAPAAAASEGGKKSAPKAAKKESKETAEDAAE